DEDEKPTVLSHRELCGGITRAANLFAELGGHGAGVALLLPNVIEAELALWGAETSGYAVPINPMLSVEQMTALLHGSGAVVLVAHHTLWQTALAVRARVPQLSLVCVTAPGRAGDDGAPAFDEGIARQPDDRLVFGEPRGGSVVAAYFHTGGTTGSPKL